MQREIKTAADLTSGERFELAQLCVKHGLTNTYDYVNEFIIDNQPINTYALLRSALACVLEIIAPV